MGAVGARHPRFLRSSTVAPTSAPMIFQDLFMRGTHDLEVLTRPLISVLSNEVCNFVLAQGAQKLSTRVEVSFTRETTHLKFDD